MDEDGDSDWENVVPGSVPVPTYYDLNGDQPQPGAVVGDWFLERSNFIPLRLTLSERKYLRLLEAALQVSEYTDRIDIFHYGSKVKRIVAQIKEICAILSGLVLAADYKQVRPLKIDVYVRLKETIRAKNSSQIATLRRMRNSISKSLSLDGDIK